MKSPPRTNEEYEAEPEDDDCSTDASSETSESSDFSTLTGLSELSGQEWKPAMKPLLWIRKEMQSGANPRTILAQILPSGTVISPELKDMSLWRILASMLSEPPQRHKLRHINTIEDAIHLIKTCTNIVVLTGAGVSVSCGIPDFRSKNGIYSRLANDFPGLPDPQAMFDITYFSKDPRPFYKFAREIYPGQFKPSPCHEFLKRLETKSKLLRNYTQNIDTLERVAGIENVVECHGSFATASCTKCKFKMNANAIRADIFAQSIPLCPECQADRPEAKDVAYEDLVELGIMKPDIVFFGEGLPDSFHSAITNDKDKCDLLIVIGSSLKVHPVALIPQSVPPAVPQILINREQLCQFEFDVELLGDSDTIIAQLCSMLGDDYKDIAEHSVILSESNRLQDRQAVAIDETNRTSAISNSKSAKSAALSGIRNSDGSASSSHIGAKSGFISKKHQRQRHTKPQVDAAKITSLLDTRIDGVDQSAKKSSVRILASVSDQSMSETIGVQSIKADWTKADSISEKLCSRTYYRHPKKGIYVFPGAQVHLNPSDSDNDDSTATSDNDEPNESAGNRSQSDDLYDGSPPQIKKPRPDLLV